MYEFAVQMEGGYGELSPNVHLDIDAFTVELWARVNTLKNATLIGRWDEEPGVYADCSYRIAIMSNGTLRFDIVKWDNGFIEFDTAWASGLIGPGKTIPLDTWFHVAVVIDNHDVRLYANGTLEANSITDQLAHDPAAPALRIAAHMALSPPAWPEGTNYFDGDLDEIRISYHAVYSGDSFIPETEYSDVPNTQLYYGKDTADHPSLQTGSGTCSPGCKAQVSYGGPACMGPE
jgi:hypothetical protein